ncbi:hypothetical protein G9A89_021326 [Geosiphon pyriformis]|nr:hypothetical protein G9A89_021326 [Geosiphon pyriformis]
MESLEAQFKKSTLAQLEKEIHELDVLDGELETLHPKAKIYRQVTDNSNIFLVVKNKLELVTQKRKEAASLKKELKKIKNSTKK